MKKNIIFWFLLGIPVIAFSQERNNTWLLGNDPGWPNVGRMVFDTNSYQLLTEQRKMPFKGTQATISDDNGNFLMSSNGVWIANANNDTMMNGQGLNPGPNVNSNPDGLLDPYANLLFPFPGDSSKYVLIHHTHDWDGYSYPSYKVFESIIDINLDGGLGGVILKNNIIFSDTMNWGFGACKHANGRDWWIVASKHNSDKIFKLLYTPYGVTSISSQYLNVPVAWYNVTHLDFSPNGEKFAYSVYDSVSINSTLLLFDFDRCSGLFSNPNIIPITNGIYLWGVSFSPNSNFLYTCSSGIIFQINITNLSIDTVATYDGFISGFPPTCCATTFFNMYLAANGKIYVTSGSSVKHLHEMNFPDSAGVACDIQQHAISLGNYFHLRAVPNHPNYFLGPVVGSICDSLTSTHEITHDFKFAISPNPNNGNFNILYLLPQNKKGQLQIYDINGRRIYEMNLPPWSTMQNISLPSTIADGIYNCVISSGNSRVNKKLAVVRE